MQKVVTLFISIMLGTAVAAGIAFLVHLIFPRIAIAVFAVLTVYWVWAGWRYAVMRDRIEEDARNPFAQLIQQQLAARRNETIESLAAALERAEQGKARPTQTQPGNQALPKVLIFDRNADFATSLAEVLEAWGCAATATSFPSDAIDGMQRGGFELCIFEICEFYGYFTFDNLIDWPQRFIFLGFDDDGSLQTRLTRHTLKRFLEKPINPVALKETVQALLAQGGQQAVKA